MAVKITEPNVDQVNLEDWEKFVLRTTKQGGGFICMELSHINNSQKPEIVAGSRLEVNGVFFEVGPNNESIPDTPSSPNIDGNNYIYANPGSNSSLSFSFSNSTPTWSAAKGGWYSGNSRAVAKFFFIDGNYNNKVILDNYNAMQKVNTNQTVPNSGGLSVSSHEPGNAPIIMTINLVPGMYRYQVCGGSSGNGGAGGAGGDGNGNTDTGGSNGASGIGDNPGESINGTFIHYGGNIYIKVGADGGDGGIGGKGANGFYDIRGAAGGAGGGGGSGIESVLNGIVARGGLPGKGGELYAHDGSYGIGGDGSRGKNNGGNTELDGTRGQGIKNTSSGYARIWRVG